MVKLSYHIDNKLMWFKRSFTIYSTRVDENVRQAIKIWFRSSITNYVKAGSAKGHENTRKLHVMVTTSLFAVYMYINEWKMYVGNREVCFWFTFHKESLLFSIHLQLLCVYFCIHVGLFIIYTQLWWSLWFGVSGV